MQSIYPAAPIGDSLPITFYLKHFRTSTINYILKETGYDNITQYEDLCRGTDSFPVQLNMKGYIVSDYPDVNTDVYRVFALSLHHLHWTVRDHIMDHYIGMELLDYELIHSRFNTIYIWVPYNVEYKEPNEEIVSEEDEETEDDISEEEAVSIPPPTKVSKTQQKRIVVESSDSEEEEPRLVLKKQQKRIVVESDDDVPLVPLNGWKFTMNTATKNSYILTPPEAIKSVYNGKVCWGSNTTHTTWNAPLSGLERPIYYSQKHMGWIVSLKLRDPLVAAGAREQLSK